MKRLIIVATLICALHGSCEARMLTASWYSEKSLKDDGQWARTKGVMANGNIFNDRVYTAASCDYPLGTSLRISDARTGVFIIAVVTDRTNKRFTGKRIDLSRAAFAALAPLDQGIIDVNVERR